MRDDILVYLAGPITPKNGNRIEENVANATRVYWECLERGIPAFCPHLGAAFPTAFSIDYEIWLEYDREIIKRCTHVLMLLGWEQSAGARQELEFAQSLGKDIVYSINDL
jgi:hypothetical protein